MNYALIFAGGVGSRMNYGDIPKQFLTIGGKSIIILTIEKFDQHEDIDGILVVCVKEHINRLSSELQEHQVAKIIDVIPGGSTAQESILIGLKKLKEFNNKNNTILIHDGVRPVIDDDLITRNINTVAKHGSSVTIVPCKETILYRDGEESSGYSALERSNCIIARAPQCFKIDDVLPAAESSYTEQLEFIDTYSLMEHCGVKASFVEGQHSNIKITTIDDYLMAKNLLEGKYLNE
ncbi:IspD/TarI family cytidylyltransferase [Vibrio splendidus]|uniref:IspD/TarI family cytidylyltransferase n=1 Tax=Vibrio splendidus TaxID=29497 RepID=UPI000D39E2DD|nr:IspD/TarI family cytidylyltransferase [Vibrio splendidus]PTP29409.1 2-C-methyl-D-erythritol 4-phosphate cytidylyltransferase [Vibrio splendidus]